MRSFGPALALVAGLALLLLALETRDLWLAALVMAWLGGGLAMQWLATKATAEAGRIVAGLTGAVALAGISVGLIWEALTFTPQFAIRLGLLCLGSLGLFVIAFGLYWMVRT